MPSDNYEEMSAPTAEYDYFLMNVCLLHNRSINYRTKRFELTLDVMYYNFTAYFTCPFNHVV